MAAFGSSHFIFHLLPNLIQEIFAFLYEVAFVAAMETLSFLRSGIVLSVVVLLGVASSFGK